MENIPNRTSIPGFWDIGPHAPLPVEKTWQDFVRKYGGHVVSDIVPEPRNFQNADFLFQTSGVVAELKEIETEFSTSSAFAKGFDGLMTRLVAEQPTWRPELFGGDGKVPTWFNQEFARIFRPPLSRILKKANRQLRETKAHFRIETPTGVLLLVNDGFTSLSPNIVRALTASLLVNSYSSIDCLVYLTVNRYVEVVGSDRPNLLWAPSYSDRSSDELLNFVNDLGRQWFNYLEGRIGSFTSRTEISQSNSTILHGSRVLVIPTDIL